MGIILALAILGLIFIKNYSTVICWVAIVGVVLYYLGRHMVWNGTLSVR